MYLHSTKFCAPQSEYYISLSSFWNIEYIPKKNVYQNTINAQQKGIHILKALFFLCRMESVTALSGPLEFSGVYVPRIFVYETPMIAQYKWKHIWKELIFQRRMVRAIDWCCFYHFARNSLVALLEALCPNFFFRFVNIGFFWHFFLCVCARSLTKPFFSPSQPGSYALLSPFLWCADCTCVLVCVCLCMCMWNCVGKVINI